MKSSIANGVNLHKNDLNIFVKWENDIYNMSVNTFNNIPIVLCLLHKLKIAQSILVCHNIVSSCSIIINANENMTSVDHRPNPGFSKTIYNSHLDRLNFTYKILLFSYTQILMDVFEVIFLIRQIRSVNTLCLFLANPE